MPWRTSRSPSSSGNSTKSRPCSRPRRASVRRGRAFPGGPRSVVAKAAPHTRTRPDSHPSNEALTQSCTTPVSAGRPRGMPQRLSRRTRRSASLQGFVPLFGGPRSVVAGAAPHTRARPDSHPSNEALTQIRAWPSAIEARLSHAACHPEREPADPLEDRLPLRHALEPLSFHREGRG